MIVVLDSNVWISALEFGGVPGRAVTRALTVDQLALSDFIEQELLRVLVHKFGREQTALRNLLDELLTGALRIETFGSITGACRDPHDDRILESAVAANARLLVAGDKDLLALKTFREISIVTPAEYLALAI